MNEVGLGHKILFFLREVDAIVSNEPQMPVCFEIDASNSCQNDCDFCMFAFHIKKNRVHLSRHNFIKAIWDMKDMGVRAITFTGGGEPLMNPHIKDMVNIAHSFRFKIGLVTNGILLDKIMDDAHVFEYVRVSLDCATRETYYRTKHSHHFDRIIYNLKTLVDQRKTDVGLSFVITDDNRDEIDAFHDLAESIGVDYAQVKPELKQCDMLAQTKDVDHNKFFVTERYNIDRDAEIACKIAGLIGVLNATGKVYYCCVHRGKSEFEIGDINTNSLNDIFSWRFKFKPNLKLCRTGSCRYMNYAKVYDKVKERRFKVLRHRRFI